MSVWGARWKLYVGVGCVRTVRSEGTSSYPTHTEAAERAEEDGWSQENPQRFSLYISTTEGRPLRRSRPSCADTSSGEPRPGRVTHSLINAMNVFQALAGCGP